MDNHRRSLFGTEEYFQTTVSEAFAANYIEGYECFGWKVDESQPSKKQGEKVVLSFVRDKNILNKTELTRLQRQFEDCMTQIQYLQRRADSIPLATALTAGLVGTAFVAGAVFAVTAAKPIIWLTVLLAIPGFALWGAAYPICLREQKLQREKLLPLIDAKFDEAAETARKAKNLL